MGNYLWMHNRTYCLFTFLVKGKVLGIVLIFITGNWLCDTPLYLSIHQHIHIHTQGDRNREREEERKRERGHNKEEEG